MYEDSGQADLLNEALGLKVTAASASPYQGIGYAAATASYNASVTIRAVSSPDANVDLILAGKGASSNLIFTWDQPGTALNPPNSLELKGINNVVMGSGFPIANSINSSVAISASGAPGGIGCALQNVTIVGSGYFAPIAALNLRQGGVYLGLPTLLRSADVMFAPGNLLCANSLAYTQAAFGTYFMSVTVPNGTGSLNLVGGDGIDGGVALSPSSTLCVDSTGTIAPWLVQFEGIIYATDAANANNAAAWSISGFIDSRRTVPIITSTVTQLFNTLTPTGAPTMTLTTLTENGVSCSGVTINVKGKAGIDVAYVARLTYTTF